MYICNVILNLFQDLSILTTSCVGKMDPETSSG
jgi:hypothetical protein